MAVGRPAYHGHRRRRRKQWWKEFTSPVLMVIAVPALIFPIATAIVLRGTDTPLTPVELTINGLPTAAPTEGFAETDASPLGAGDARLSLGAALPLYAASARPTAARLAARDSERAASGADRTFALTEFALLHPQARDRDNMLIGDLPLVYDNPATLDLSARIFQEYCTARPGDPYYTLSITALPINPALKAAVIQWEATPGVTSRCPSVTG